MNPTLSTLDPGQRARLSLDGLSVGDAFGECFFFSPDLVFKLIRAGVMPGPPYEAERIEEYMMDQCQALREVPATAPWKWTDDTAMALAIVQVLEAHSQIDEEALARAFGRRYLKEPARGYGSAMHTLLPDLAHGGDWKGLSAALFEGRGSYGNGASMRVAPVGAFFADDLERCALEARRSALVTHAHEQGVAGAIAVAVAAGAAWQLRDKIASSRAFEPNSHQDQVDEARQVLAGEFFELILPHVPAGAVRDGIECGRDMPLWGEIAVDEVTEMLGNGGEVTAQDTVPFVLWCASQRLDCYEDALWIVVSGLGDRDTTSAIVGGIVALSSRSPIPPTWISNREPLF